MSRNRGLPRLQTDRRKLRPIAAEGSPPDMPLPLASFTVRSAEPPRVTTEVLTASHIINWAAGWAIGRGSPVRFDIRRGQLLHRLTAFTKIPDVKVSTMDEDYAVLTLADRLGDRFGWLGITTYDSDYDDEPIFRTIGYANDIAGGQLDS